MSDPFIFCFALLSVLYPSVAITIHGTGFQKNKISAAGQFYFSVYRGKLSADPFLLKFLQLVYMWNWGRRFKKSGSVTLTWHAFDSPC